MSLLGLLKLSVIALSPIAYKRYLSRVGSKSHLASSLCEVNHDTSDDKDACPKSHLVERRGAQDSKILVITTIKGDDKYWELFFRHLPEALSGVAFHFSLILESPSDQQLKTALELTKWIANLSVVQTKNSSIYAAWNLAIKISRSEFISNLNVDDLRNPGSYKAQLDILADVPNAAGIYGGYREFTEWGTAPQPDLGSGAESKDMSLANLVFRGENPMHASPIWKRELHDQIGLFNEKYLSSGDTEFWLRALSHDFKFVRDSEARYLTLKRLDSVSSPRENNGRFEWAETLDKFSRKSLLKLLTNCLP